MAEYEVACSSTPWRERQSMGALATPCFAQSSDQHALRSKSWLGEAMINFGLGRMLRPVTNTSLGR